MSGDLNLGLPGRSPAPEPLRHSGSFPRRKERPSWRSSGLEAPLLCSQPGVPSHTVLRSTPAPPKRSSSEQPLAAATASSKEGMPAVSATGAWRGAQLVPLLLRLEVVLVSSSLLPSPLPVVFFWVTVSACLIWCASASPSPDWPLGAFRSAGVRFLFGKQSLLPAAFPNKGPAGWAGRNTTSHSQPNSPLPALPDPLYLSERLCLLCGRLLSRRHPGTGKESRSSPPPGQGFRFLFALDLRAAS